MSYLLPAPSSHPPTCRQSGPAGNTPGPPLSLPPPLPQPGSLAPRAKLGSSPHPHQARAAQLIPRPCLAHWAPATRRPWRAVPRPGMIPSPRPHSVSTQCRGQSSGLPARDQASNHAALSSPSAWFLTALPACFMMLCCIHDINIFWRSPVSPTRIQAPPTDQPFPRGCPQTPGRLRARSSSPWEALRWPPELVSPAVKRGERVVVHSPPQLSRCSAGGSTPQGARPLARTPPGTKAEPGWPLWSGPLPLHPHPLPTCDPANRPQGA